MLEVKDLCKTYTGDGVDFQALRHVDLRIDKGDCLAIVGKSGSGKSTLMHLLACLDMATTGHVFVDGSDTSALSEKAKNTLRNEKFGFVFQQFFLNGRETVFENVVLPMRIRGATAALRQQIPDALAAANQLDRTQQRVAAREGQPRLVEPSAFDAFHGERDGAARADRVDAELVAQPRCAEHGVRIAHAAQRTQRKQALVLQADAALATDRVDVLAPDGARDAARPRPIVRGAELLRRDAGGPGERAALKVARRQRAEAIERQQIGCGPELAVFRGGRAKRSL